MTFVAGDAAFKMLEIGIYSTDTGVVKSKMHAAAFYKTSDPINNFRIKIQLWRSSSLFPKTESARSHTSSPDISNNQNVDEYTFSWQEKVFSQSEFDKYSKAIESCLPIESKYQEDVLKIKKNLKSYPKYLCSKVEADPDNADIAKESTPTTTNYVHPLLEQRSLIASQVKAGGHASYNTGRIRPAGSSQFGGTIHHKGRVVEFIPSDEFKNSRSHVQGTFQTMYIMADVTRSKQAELTKQGNPTEEGQQNNEMSNNENKENLPKEDEKSSKSQGDEIVLCKIKYDSSSGLLVVKPDFNGNRDPYDVPATSHSDSFEYLIIHSSNQMTSQDRERDRQTLSLVDAQRVNLLRSSVGPDFEIPFRDVFRITAFGEIITATDFEYDNLYVQYSWDLPQMWSLAPRCPAGGVTHRAARMLFGDQYVANFSTPVELDAFYQCIPEYAESVLRFPSLLVHVASLDNWNRLRTEGYGFADVPTTCGSHVLNIKCWRPVGNSLFDEVRRFFIGSSLEVEDLTYARLPSSFKGNHFSKMGFRAQTTGTVTVRLNILQQVGESGGASAELLQQLTGRSNIGYVPDSGENTTRVTHRGMLGLSALSMAVQSVLDGYQRAKEKLAAAKEGLPNHVRAALMLRAAEVQEQQQTPQQQQFSSVASALVSSRMSRFRPQSDKKES